MKYPRWEGHKYNQYSSDKKHYNNSDEEKNRIQEIHSVESQPESKTLNEWFTSKAGISSLGAFNTPDNEGINRLKDDNHGLVNDNHGLVIDHINEVKKYINEKSLHRFVQNVKDAESRLENLNPEHRINEATTTSSAGSFETPLGTRNDEDLSPCAPLDRKHINSVDDSRDALVGVEIADDAPEVVEIDDTLRDNGINVDADIEELEFDMEGSDVDVDVYLTPSDEMYDEKEMELIKALGL